jgi:hypothetical protein
MIDQADLVGGYYDAGDHVKFGLPMAFTVTMLSWSLIEYGDDVAAAGELGHALEAIKWGTDYFIKAHTSPDELWAEVTHHPSTCSIWQPAFLLPAASSVTWPRAKASCLPPLVTNNGDRFNHHPPRIFNVFSSLFSYYTVFFLTFKTPRLSRSAGLSQREV